MPDPISARGPSLVAFDRPKADPEVIAMADGRVLFLPPLWMRVETPHSQFSAQRCAMVSGAGYQ